MEETQTKDRHARALARAGSSDAARTRAAIAMGSRTSRAKKRAVRANGRLGGRPPRYRWNGPVLERRSGTRWYPLREPYDPAAREAIRRLALAAAGW